MTTPRIEVADDDGVDTYPTGVAIILDTLGHPKAFITDLSQVTDFRMKELEDEDDEYLTESLLILEELSALADRPVGYFDRLWEVARDIEAIENER